MESSHVVAIIDKNEYHLKHEIIEMITRATINLDVLVLSQQQTNRRNEVKDKLAELNSSIVDEIDTGIF